MDGIIAYALLKRAMAGKAPAITDTVSGTEAVISDGADGLPVKDLTVKVVSVAAGSGTPSPDNIRAISGWTGARIRRTGENLFVNSGWKIVESQNVVKSPMSPISLRTDDDKITFYNLDNQWYGYPFAYEEDGTFVGRLSGTKRTHCTAARTDFTLGGGSQNYGKIRYVEYSSTPAMDPPATIEQNNRIMMRYGDYDADLDGGYAPYNGTTTYTVDWEDEAGTVYGGTLDVTTGLLTVETVGKTLDGTEGFTLSTTGNYRRFQKTFSGLDWAAFKDNSIPFSSHFERVGTSTAERLWGTFRISNDEYLIFFDNDPGSGTTMADADAFNTWLATQKTNGTPVQVCYDLDTPVTYQLTPTEVNTLLGVNNIWADTGGVTVEYRADTTLYIRKLTGAEADMVADANIASGKYFMVGNSLYISTAAIASGEAIVPGTNCTLTNLAEALNALNT